MSCEFNDLAAVRRPPTGLRRYRDMFTGDPIADIEVLAKFNRLRKVEDSEGIRDSHILFGCLGAKGYESWEGSRLSLEQLDSREGRARYIIERAMNCLGNGEAISNNTMQLFTLFKQGTPVSKWDEKLGLT